MSQSIRQSELFSAQDWQVLYQAFTQINFNASDPPSINRALRQYLQANYAEDFNDWIASSEFVMVLDLLSWLAGSLAFKTDISARENFLDSATARESILRLARFLSYNAKRNQPAKGLLKLISIQTNDDVYDAFGSNLKGTTINWNDSNNAEWFDQMALVLNSAFVSTNPFGLPLSTGTYQGIKTQIYRFNGNFGANQSSLPFTQSIEGVSTKFEITNIDFDPTLGFIERAPNLSTALHCTYRSDGFGNASSNTGFFFGFTQGQLQSQVFNIINPIENQLLDITTPGINQTDVWVQSVDAAGNDLIDWTPVPVVFSDNITFNSLAASDRNIFQVITRDNDAVSLRFSDGRFGNAPSGLLRVWYRTSNGLSYQIRPSDMGNPRMVMSYLNRRGVTKTLTLTFELEDTITNSAPAETIEQIRRRAPLVYATQNRMVSGEDYNTYPLQSNLATKIKALTRVYSGQSRFIDLNDPTSNYADTTVFADDGIFYSEGASSYTEIPLSDNLTSSQLIDRYIQPPLVSNETTNWVRDSFIKTAQSGGIVLPSLIWTQVSGGAISSTGYFSAASQFVQEGALINFALPDGTDQWVGVVSLIGASTTVPSGLGVLGPVTLASPVPTSSMVVTIIPRYASTLTSDVRAMIATNILSNVSFTLWYDYANVNELMHYAVRSKSYVPTGSTEKKIMSVDCLSGAIWRVKSVGLRYAFESQKAVQFYFDGAKAVDTSTGQIQQDIVRIMDINLSINGGSALGRNYDLTIDKMIRYPNGLIDPRRTAVVFTDADNDGYPDDPDTFYKIVSNLASSTYLFWQAQTDGTFLPIFNMNVFAREQDRIGTRGVGVGSVAFQVASSTTPETFWVKTANGWTEDYRNYRFGKGRGPNTAFSWINADGSTDTTIKPSSIRYMWRHFATADRRIDPSRSNIIDMFILPTEYDTLVRQWIANGALPADCPTPVTDFELRQMFAGYEAFKMFSDDIVWRPVQYRFLFGQSADSELRANFNVVKLLTTTLSDGEIKTRVLNAISAYFGTDFWDFGETFYYTELAAYIHQQLSGIVASVVIVPEVTDGSFGDLFQVQCRADEIFISTAQVSDIIMIDSNTAANLRLH